jgi:hypothetical protein
VIGRRPREFAKQSAHSRPIVLRFRQRFDQPRCGTCSRLNGRLQRQACTIRRPPLACAVHCASNRPQRDRRETSGVQCADEGPVRYAAEELQLEQAKVHQGIAIQALLILPRRQRDQIHALKSDRCASRSQLSSPCALLHLTATQRRVLALTERTLCNRESPETGIPEDGVAHRH